MKTNHLRTTVLVLAGTLIAAFFLGEWRVSRQAAAMRELQPAVSAAREELADLQRKLAATHDAMKRMETLAASSERVMSMHPGRFPMQAMHRAKRGFNDIQRHVAKGEFAGLSLTDGYMELREIFDNPAFEEMLANDHRTMAQ